MPQDSLGDFLSLSHDAGEVIRISATVDPSFEIAEITRRVSGIQGGGPILFFESVRGSALPVVTNLLANDARFCRALNIPGPDQLATHLLAMNSSFRSADWFSSFETSSAGRHEFSPKLTKQAVCQQIVKLGRDVNLWEWPILRCWPIESYPVITSGIVVTRHPLSGERSLETVPVEVIDKQQVIIHWHAHNHGTQYAETAPQVGQKLPLAIILGGPPAWLLTGSARLPAGVDAYDFAGQLMGAPTVITKCRTNDLEVPAHVELVVECLLDPSEQWHSVNPIGLTSGFSGLPSGMQPVAHVTAVTHCANPIFPAQIPGIPNDEILTIRHGLLQLFLPWIRSCAPEIVDCRELTRGYDNGLLCVSIRKTYARQAHKVLHALWGHPQTMFAKSIVIVDDHVNLTEPGEVWRAFAVHADMRTDVMMSGGIESPEGVYENLQNSGGKLGIDATDKLPEERCLRAGATRLGVSEEIKQIVTDRWMSYGLPNIEG